MDQFTVTAVTSLLVVVDPVGALPAYMAISGGDGHPKRCRTALRASLAATAALALFAAGDAALRALGLTLPAVQVAGGLVLFLVAVDMLRARRATQESPAELDEGRGKDDVAITPLAIPMLAGPASLATVAALMGQARGWGQVAGVYAAIAAVGVAAYVTLRLADPLYRRLGRTGAHVLTRLLGLVLAAIAVQFVLDGLRAAGAIS